MSAELEKIRKIVDFNQSMLFLFFGFILSGVLINSCENKERHRDVLQQLEHIEKCVCKEKVDEK